MADGTAVIMARMDERLRSLVEKIDDIEKLRREENEELHRRISVLENRLKTIEDMAIRYENRLKTIEDMAIRYKGGFLAVLSLGGIIGWFTSNLDFMRSLIGWAKGV